MHVSHRSTLPDTLVLSGGGLRAIHGLGALAQLKRAGSLAGVRHVVGTSSGSILGAAYVTDQLRRGLGLALRQKGGWDIKIHKLSTNFGVDSGKMLDDFIESLFVDFPDITFAELAKESGVDFHVCATNLTQRKVVFFSAEGTPNMKVAVAIRHSCTIPPMFAVKRSSSHEDIFVDGGLIANFPVVHGRRLSRNGKIIAIGYLSSSCFREPITNLRGFLSAVCETMLTPCETEIHENPGDMFVFLRTGQTALDFSADVQRRFSWFLDGASQAKLFLKKIE